MEDVQKPTAFIIDPVTGEVKDEMFEGDRIKIIRKKQIEFLEKNRQSLEKDKIYSFGQDTKFSMLSSYSAKQLADEKLTATEYRILLAMISNTNYKSGLIAFGNNKPLTTKWLTEKMIIDKKTTRKSVRTLIDLGIIAESTTNHKTQYFFNPYIQYRGRWINKTLYDMFKNTKWAKRNT